ncbi:uncharacterized histidine-rich protein DDB_G0274557-like isoform X2 [Leptidea sinapis]|uniref:uncharacterized histidine-rich protein DDB_G0274557-like isoform X2 n=1 Tax=Leptidea sinapis TaxID=189913 RepID=UPI0021C45151|nr:uncharacterized histidine-rich protein DDB_G0274557-like isoform X2 [Leptidea sinapis]
MTSTKQMLLPILMVSLFNLVTSAGDEYLPPVKGYNYDRPKIPFPTINQVNRPTPQPQPRPTLPPQRPTLAPQRPTYIPPGPTQRPTPTPHQHHDNPDHHHHDDQHDHHHHHEPGMPFDFAYAVNEDGNDYSHNAISDGDITRGEYRVALPDGRTQVVKYTADWKNGFNAQVSYEGEATYPDQPNFGSGSGNQGYKTKNQAGGYVY